MSRFIPNECIFYHIYPLGFTGAPKNEGESTKAQRIKKITDHIPHMKSLGVNALYLDLCLSQCITATTLLITDL